MGNLTKQCEPLLQSPDELAYKRQETAISNKKSIYFS